MGRNVLQLSSVEEIISLSRFVVIPILVSFLNMFHYNVKYRYRCVKLSLNDILYTYNPNI